MTRLAWPVPSPGVRREWCFPPVGRAEQDNGLLVWTCDLPGRRLVAVRVVVPMGALTEPTGRRGIATLAAKGLLEGVPGLDSAAFAVAIESLGATVRVDVTWAAAVVAMDLPVEALDEGLALLAQLLMRPAFPDPAVSRLTAEQLDALRQQEADPSSRAGLLLMQHLFDPTSRYAEPLGGTPATLAVVDRADVAAHHARWCTASGSTVVVAGALDGVDLGSRLAEVLDGWTGDRAGASIAALPPTGSAQRIIVLDRPGAVQSAVVFGRITPPRADPAQAGLELAVTGVVANFTGRVNQRLREEMAYTYGASASVDFRPGFGVLQGGFTCRTDATGAAVADTVTLLADARDNGPTKTELAQARSVLVDMAPLRLETAAAMATTLAHYAALDLSPEEFTRARSAHAAASVEEVARCTADYLDPAALTFAVVGDANAVVGDLEGAGAGPVSVVADA